MDLRPALTELAEQHQLSRADVARLHSLAGLDDEPDNLKGIIPIGIGILGAALAGLGIIFWIAANWNMLGRVAQFALLESVVVVMCAGAVWRMNARLPLGVLACLAIGGLFAFFGQTYQTGADPWQLFALWAGLAIPLCLGVRHDGLWVVWTLVAMTAITLWSRANNGPSWQIGTSDTAVQLLSWSVAILITTMFTPQFRSYHGGGAWSMRLALSLTALMIGFDGIAGLFVREISQPTYFLAVLVFGSAASVFAALKMRDTFSLCSIGLGLNVLLVGGVVRLVFRGIGNDFVMPLLITGCAAALLLAATVKIILKLSRLHAEGDGA